MNCLGITVHSLVLCKLALKHFPANGTVDDFQGEQFYSVNAKSAEKINLPFQLSMQPE